MEKITIKTGVDVLTDLETQIEFNNLSLNVNAMPVPMLSATAAPASSLTSNVNLVVKKQYLKKDGVTIHNEEHIHLGVKSEDSAALKLSKEKAIEDFIKAVATPLTALLTALKN